MAEKKITFVKALKSDRYPYPTWSAWDDMGRYWYLEYYRGKGTAVGAGMNVLEKDIFDPAETEVNLPELLYHMGIEYCPDLLDPRMVLEAPYPLELPSKPGFRIEKGGDPCWTLIRITDAETQALGPFTEAFAGWLFHHFCVYDLSWKLVKLQKPGTS